MIFCLGSIFCKIWNMEESLERPDTDEIYNLCKIILASQGDFDPAMVRPLLSEKQKEQWDKLVRSLFILFLSGLDMNSFGELKDKIVIRYRLFRTSSNDFDTSATLQIDSSLKEIIETLL